MSKKEKTTREYLETLSKEQVIDLCLQYINDKNIAEQQLEALMLEISKQEVEQHDLPDYCTRTGTDCTNLGKIEELQRQLAEKDKKIEDLKQQNTLLENENGKLAKELIVKNYKKAQKEVSFGIQLAIQELEKVREWLEPKYFDYEQINYLTRIIDNQIKELKGE